METNERSRIINELKQSAKEVRDITDEQRKRRPIVIEFSGSPKAGKTSCINSLKQFLKRNGFEVAIIQERASICPVCDKHSPMFNIWTACTSIAGLVGILESKNITCNVLILDRGIFDALCWFEWLSKQGKVDESLRKIIDEFLLINEFINKIDIVFSFCVEPFISIKREYANLLTDELGTIMNEKVLKEYLDAFETTTKEKGKFFNSIYRIDTSSKDQDEISKEVTEVTLRILKELFIEKIGFFRDTEELRSILRKKKIGEIEDIKLSLNNLEFESRKAVESTNTFYNRYQLLFFRTKRKIKY